MTHSGFTALSEIYKLLAMFDHTTLQAASRHKSISPELRTALRALAEESRRSASNQRQFDFDHSSPSTARNQPLRPDNGTKTIRGLTRHIQLLLADRRRFPTKESLRHFASTLGIAMPSDKKMSIDRTISHLLKKIMSSTAAQEIVIREHLMTRDPQSSGWLDVILRSH